MPRYRVTHRETRETYEVEAPFAQVACERLGWLIGHCHVQVIREGPYTNLSEPPMRVVRQGPATPNEGGDNGSDPV